MSPVCDCSDDTGEMPQFHVVNLRRAQKPHNCCECGEIIAVGEQYEDVRGKWDGVFERYITCLKCVDIRSHYFPRGFIYGAMNMGLDGELREISRMWFLGKDRIIAGLVDLVCELLEVRHDTN